MIFLDTCFIISAGLYDLGRWWCAQAHCTDHNRPDAKPFAVKGETPIDSGAL